MKIRIKNLTLRQLICCITGVLSLLLFGVLTWFGVHAAGNLAEQQMAERWSNVAQSAQISCFFSQGTEVTKETILRFESQLETVLQEESITSASENENARMWAGAYSGSGEVTVMNGKKKVTAKAVGVGGDFFLFHPLRLLYGTFFSGSAGEMQDYIVIDEDTAWQLFGSSDVAGMQVTIGGVPHIISGVIKRDSGRINDAAGNGETTIYLSYHSLESYGVSQGIGCYEIVMPNPISGYALNLVKERIGIEEKNIECVENSKRYSLLSLWNVFSAFGSRSMSAKAIIYPYWENIARGWEDILAMILLLRAIFLLIPVVMLIVLVVKLWRRRTWNLKTVLEGIKNGFGMAGKGFKHLGKKAKKYKKKKEKEAEFD